MPVDAHQTKGGDRDDRTRLCGCRFGNKDQLFDIVMDTHVARILDHVPSYGGPAWLLRRAVRLSDRPPLPVTTSDLEQLGAHRPAAQARKASGVNAAETNAITQAQTNGHIPKTFTAE